MAVTLGLRSSFVTALLLLGCSSQTGDPESSATRPKVDVDETEGEEPASSGPPHTTKSADDPGPPPVGCKMEKDDDGFFVRSSGKSEYVAYVPKGYAGAPSRLLVGLHGCGDSSRNFAEWGVNPYEMRQSQEHIGIAVDGASGDGGCWTNDDIDKVMAAIDDISKCVYVHKQKIVLAGFSSGGMLAYRIGLTRADRFAGILIENATYSGVDPAAAAWKLPVAHRAHRDDEVFPIGKVRESWKRLRAAGIPLETDEVEGGHDGTTEDWAEWLIPKMAAWKSP